MLTVFKAGKISIRQVNFHCKSMDLPQYHFIGKETDLSRSLWKKSYCIVYASSCHLLHIHNSLIRLPGNRKLRRNNGRPLLFCSYCAILGNSDDLRTHYQTSTRLTPAQSALSSAPEYTPCANSVYSWIFTFMKFLFSSKACLYYIIDSGVYQGTGERLNSIIISAYSQNFRHLNCLTDNAPLISSRQEPLWRHMGGDTFIRKVSQGCL